MTPIKLNLGSGGTNWPGFVNVDLANNWSGVRPDVIAPLTGLPFDDGYADEAHSIHSIEHLYRWDTEKALSEWVRVLKPGGMLAIECPCLDKILGIYVDAAQAGKAPSPRLTIWGLYGDPGYRNPDMNHKWCFCKDELAQLMTAAGLKDIRSETPHFHRKERDMRMVGFKG